LLFFASENVFTGTGTPSALASRQVVLYDDVVNILPQHVSDVNIVFNVNFPGARKRGETERDGEPA
jgi:hypothetical protein